MPLKIATWNINSVRLRIDLVAKFLKSARPDVLCLQETKAQDRDFPAAEIEAAGYQVVFRGEKSYNGVAILSKAKPTDMQFGLDDGQSPDETRLVTAAFGPVHVVNTYVPKVANWIIPCSSTS